MNWFTRLWAKEEVRTSPLKGIEPLPGEVRPPWVEYPGIPPWDFHWREAGEPWKVYIWELYYNALTEDEQAAYLERWKVPADWYKSYFDKARREFWDHVDDPEE